MQELQRAHHQVRRTVAPRCPEPELHLPRGGELHLFVGQRRPGDVAARLFQPLAVLCFDSHRGVHAEPVAVGAPSGPSYPQALQQQLFENRNFVGRVVLPDLLAACAANPPASADARDGCAALRGWDRSNNLESRGAHLFREFWLSARLILGVYRIPYDVAQPVATPAGLKMDDPAVAGKVWDTLAQAVKNVRGAGFALDATLASVQRPHITEEPIGLHGGDEVEGVLNNLRDEFASAITTRGLRINYGTSYVQTVTFDERGPVVQAILAYGQSTDPASPHATDQMKLFSAKQWPRLPFHADEVELAKVGAPLRLVRP